ncbi:MAG: 4-hydroxythreonine-4-phosphate dehydrogenase PdxA [Marinicaulis sp.]|nr:4-hydroxythreonine-4-phosphate dehydrogenase PdxA [Marinicaulis sp.]
MTLSLILPPLALTMGDPGGVGGEITVKAWRVLRECGPVFFLIDDPTRLRVLGVDVEEISDPSQAHAIFKTALPIMALKAPIKSAPGVSDTANAKAVIESIERAVAFALDGSAAGVVTNPIQKSSLLAHGFGFPGHTEFLANLTKDTPMPEGRQRGAVMMLAGPQLKTVPVTIHQSVKDAIKSLTPDLIVKTALVVAQSLREDFGIAAPRLAISGLNPHAGEEGMMGAEDALIIAPAIDMLREFEVDARGPLPADTMFHEEARENYDAAICMLHDQALIPAKTLSFHDAVNVTLGLPIIRTSPDHGTALDIAGKGVARSDSLIAALKLAGVMAMGRRAIK